jgi:hypothetical protein
VTNQMAAPGQFFWDKAMHDADPHAAPNEERAHALLREAGVNWLADVAQRALDPRLRR